jgi:hypothetical protein
MVPERIFLRGPRGAEAVQAFRNAVGDDQALPMLQDFAAASLRRRAQRADGSFDQQRMEAWQRDHSEAMRAFPELARRFADVAQAEGAVAEAAARQQQQVAAAQRGAAARLMRADPEDVPNIVGRIMGADSSVTQVRQLAERIGQDAEAQQGMRRAIVEHIQRQLVGNTEAAATGQGMIRADAFQTFMRRNQPVLRLFFDEPELRSLNAVALDLQQAARSQNAVRLPGGSNTAQDTAAAASFHPNSSILRGAISAAGGALAGGAVGGPIGSAAGSALGGVVSSMRRAGFSRAEEIITQAMLDPAMARMLLMKATPENDRRVAVGLARRLSRIGAVGAMQGDSENR